MLNLITRRVPVTVIPVAFVRGDLKPILVPIEKGSISGLPARSGRKLRSPQVLKSTRAAEGRA